MSGPASEPFRFLPLSLVSNFKSRGVRSVIAASRLVLSRCDWVGTPVVLSKARVKSLIRICNSLAASEMDSLGTIDSFAFTVIGVYSAVGVFGIVGTSLPSEPSGRVVAACLLASLKSSTPGAASDKLNLSPISTCSADWLAISDASWLSTRDLSVPPSPSAWIFWAISDSTLRPVEQVSVSLEVASLILFGLSIASAISGWEINERLFVTLEEVAMFNFLLGCDRDETVGATRLLITVLVDVVFPDLKDGMIAWSDGQLVQRV